jgi:2-phosphoglycolate phosphatase
MKKSIKAVLFDLDGTLLDTAGDIGTALNRILLARNLPPLPLATIRPIVGGGYRSLLKLGLNMEPEHEDFPALTHEFINYYHEHLGQFTEFFPGMEVVLAYLEANNILWAVVTNKPHIFTMRHVEDLPLLQKAACIVSGDTLARAKPYPDPILHACELMGVDPADCLYIGDAEVDILASRAAGVAVLGALYGYIPSEINPTTWLADGYISHPEEILSWLDQIAIN